MAYDRTSTQSAKRKTAVKTALFVALALLAATPAMAFDIPAVSTKVSALPGGQYKADPHHTSILWTIRHLGLSNYTARFDKFDATLDFDPKSPESSTLTVTIDPAGVNTGMADFDKKLQGPGFFDTAKGPITFTSTKITRKTDTTGLVEGNLTLRGITRPATLDVTFNGGLFNTYMNADALGFSARTVITLADFGLTEYKGALGDTVAVTIETEFNKHRKAPANP